ncbi:MAG: hypothetical protein HFJ07_01245 [Lachnospiraceae bacterium]|nr:hypothetical protein [Lachnospiraceae bacterium]
MEQEKSERNPEREPQEAVPVNRRAKDTFFKKVYEKEERQKALISFLLGLDANKIKIANVRPILLGNKENYALIANGITYMQRIGKDKKYIKPANVSSVAEYLEMMLERGIFVDLLSDKEVCDMTMAQFSRDDILIYQGREEGKAEGKAEAVLELLEDIGEPSEMLRNYIMKQTDLEVLRRWHKIAAKADSIRDFEQAVGLLSM